MKSSKSDSGRTRQLPTPRDRDIIRAVARHGQMTREQIRRLFFQKGNELASIQATCRRLTILARRGYLLRKRLCVASGSGPYLYEPGALARMVVEDDEACRGRRSHSMSDVMHQLEIVDYYIRLKRALEQNSGKILSWLGRWEAYYRIPGHQTLPFTPDAYCLWALGREEGSFFLEWDRGTESLSRIADKLERYALYYEMRAYQDHLGEIGLRPRLLIVVCDARRQKRLSSWLAQALSKGRWTSLPTVLIAVRDDAYAAPLGQIWGRPGCGQPMRMTD